MDCLREKSAHLRGGDIVLIFNFGESHRTNENGPRIALKVSDVKSIITTARNAPRGKDEATTRTARDNERIAEVELLYFCFTVLPNQSRHTPPP